MHVFYGRARCMRGVTASRCGNVAVSLFLVREKEYGLW